MLTSTTTTLWSGTTSSFCPAAEPHTTMALCQGVGGMGGGGHLLRGLTAAKTFTLCELALLSPWNFPPAPLLLVGTFLLRGTLDFLVKGQRDTCSSTLLSVNTDLLIRTHVTSTCLQKITP